MAPHHRVREDLSQAPHVVLPRRQCDDDDMGKEGENSNASSSKPSSSSASPEPQFITLTGTNSSLEDGAICGGDSRGEYSLSLYLDRGVKEMKLSLGEHHPHVALAVTAIGDACNQNGDLEEALRFYSEALDLKRDSLDGDDPSIADTLCSVGSVLKDKFSYSESLSAFHEALTMYEHALTVSEPPLASDHPYDEEAFFELLRRKASTLNSIGGVHFEMKKFDSAMTNYQCALKVQHRASEIASKFDDVAVEATRTKVGSACGVALRDLRLQIADTLNNNASAHAETGNRIMAIKFYSEALNTQMEELGEDDPAVAITLNNIGTMNFRSGNFNVALKSYKQVLKMRKLLLGPDHASIADVLVNIAMVHEMAGDWKKAEGAYCHAYRIALHALGEKSLRLAGISMSIGDLCARDGRDSQAMEFFSDALAIYKLAGLDNDHPLLQTAATNIAALKYKSQDDFTSFLIAVRETFHTLFEDGSKAFTFHNDNAMDTLMGACSTNTTTTTMATTTVG